MNYKEFFLTNNKSGSKTRANRLLKNNPEIYQKVIDHTNKYGFGDLSFKEQIWLFIHEKTEFAKCANCGCEVNFKKSLKEGYKKYCSRDCTNSHKEHIEKSKKSRAKVQDKTTAKTKQTNLKKYGVENVMHNDIVRKKWEERNPIGIAKILEKTKENAKSHVETKYPGVEWVSTDERNYHCGTCDKTSTLSSLHLNYRYRNDINFCNHCTPTKKIGLLQSVVDDYVKSIYDDEIIFNDRKVLNGKEIDIYLPKSNFGIEFHGNYWHSEIFVDGSYHLDKLKLAINAKTHLIQIFEDEWINKKDIVKSIISNKLGKTPNKIFARKTIIKEVSGKDSKSFLNENHIQGHVKSSIKLGLYYNDELVSIMTFGGKRKALGQSHVDGEWEMLRFCNKKFTSVIGGASKLFKNFIKTHQATKVISYADRRYSDGSLYPKLGFSYIHDSKPNYFYLVNNKREHRFKYRKDVLVKEGYDSNKTEREIMQDRGIPRIYDCGHKRFEWLCP